MRKGAGVPDKEPIHRAPRAGDIRDSQADISKARNLLGYDPQFDFMEGLKITVDYFRELVGLWGGFLGVGYYSEVAF